MAAGTLPLRLQEHFFPEGRLRYALAAPLGSDSGIPCLTQKTNIEYGAAWGAGLIGQYCQAHSSPLNEPLTGIQGLVQRMREPSPLD